MQARQDPHVTHEEPPHPLAPVALQEQNAWLRRALSATEAEAVLAREEVSRRVRDLHADYGIARATRIRMLVRQADRVADTRRETQARTLLAQQQL